MNNEQIAQIFDRIANLMEIKGEVIYKTLAYRKAAENIRALPGSLNAFHQQEKLMEIPGVGKAIAEKIAEIITTGKLGFLERLEAEVPVGLLDVLEVSDVGPRKAALFWKQAGITSLAELEEAAKVGRIRALPGMGEKSESRILAGIEALKRRGHRLNLDIAREIAENWLAWIRAQKGVERAEMAGSLRRWKTTIGDIDIVAAVEQPAELMAALTAHPDVQRVQGTGENKTSLELPGGINMQVWTQPPERFGTLLQFVSGSKDHNVALRGLAQKQGVSLSERCITRADGQELLFSNEEDIYRFLGLDWIPPELREDRGEIKASAEHVLPHLIDIKDIKAELHSHTNWSDGINTIEEMARGAISRGWKIFAASDHSGGLGIAGGLQPERLRERAKEIAQVQAKLGDEITLLGGSEVEIRADGTLDYDDETLAWLDVVVASLHTSLRQPREVVTGRLLNAIRHPHVDIIGHASGRLLPNREGADLDWDLVLDEARKSGVAFEINANPSRLDLDEAHVRQAVEMGIPIFINTDAHTVDQLDTIIYGVSLAWRAWLPADAVCSTWEPDRLLTWLKTSKPDRLHI
ncbi:MAG: DNA polymerase/3'-5' exonuclease PolX [Leptolinea sp.]|jgi:DNA polymerase (family 10)|nr:DNA polymerase/3'-5' exonuclease PolX [Leptolinea sp.]